MKTIGILCILVIVIILGVSFLKNGLHPGSNTTQGASLSQNQKPFQTRIKFSSSRYASVAYKIAPGQLSDTAKVALTGFTMETKDLADGSLQVILNAQKKEYHTQTYVVKPGYTLYFIEESKNDDDHAADTDATLEDDTAVLVDQQGYIVIE